MDSVGHLAGTGQIVPANRMVDAHSDTPGGGEMNREEAIVYVIKKIMEEKPDNLHIAVTALRGPQPAPTTGLVPCGCKYCDPTHGQRYLYKENKNAPYRGMISTVEITEDDCKKYSQIEGNLYDENGNNFYFVFDIRHCPMCGRELQVAL